MSKNRTPASRAADADDPMPLGGNSGTASQPASCAMDESVESGDANELATIRVRTMYGCVFQHAFCLKTACLRHV